ncbi:polysaccharide biosynthesis protein [Albibacterium indicum]|uniref:polysaccharide biosynthesis protein n=1 Tax=Albibacterium indicum TaxID=2292082 RepID=UPI00198056E4|nr:nucleoside-diphosphate sugar epimerase/dehydratase [Pedobacter indicus]
MIAPRLRRLRIIKDFLLNDQHLPHWMVLLADMVIIYMSFTLAFGLVNLFDFQNIDFSQYIIYTGVYCAVALPVVYFGRLHTGLLRYSNTKDLFRIFAATVTFSGLFYVAMLLFGKSVIGGSVQKFGLILIVNFFICTCLLASLRVFAKSVFFILTRNVYNKKLHRVLIFGSDKNAVLLKHGLESNRDVNYRVEGFIDTDPTRLNSYLEQKKVYKPDSLERLVNRKRIDELVVVNEGLDKPNNKEIVERAVGLGLKVLTVPPANQWLSGKLDKKQIKNLRIEDLLQRDPIMIDQTEVRKDLQGKRVLITGAAGSIGSEIVRQVLSYGPSSLILCDNAESPLHNVQLEVEEDFPDVKVLLFVSDVRDYHRMEEIFEKHRPQVVYHAAAYKHVPLMENNPFEAINVNVRGSKNLADLSVRFGVKKFVMVSTDKAVNPTNIMGASKRLAEIYIQALNSYLDGETSFITTRFGNVLGSNGSVIPRFRSQIEKGGPITVTHPEITRYFMTIPEAVQLVLEAGTMGTGGEIYVFDMGEPVKIVNMAKKMIKLAGLELDKDIKIVFTGLRPGEKLYEELLASAEETIPTHHEKISIARVRSYKYQEIAEEVEDLLEINKLQIKENTVFKMKQIIPEFKSKNSEFEKLDRRIENNLKRIDTAKA